MYHSVKLACKQNMIINNFLFCFYCISIFNETKTQNKHYPATSSDEEKSKCNRPEVGLRLWFHYKFQKRDMSLFSLPLTESYPAFVVASRRRDDKLKRVVLASSSRNECSSFNNFD